MCLSECSNIGVFCWFGCDFFCCPNRANRSCCLDARVGVNVSMTTTAITSAVAGAISYAISYADVYSSAISSAEAAVTAAVSACVSVSVIVNNCCSITVSVDQSVQASATAVSTAIAKAKSAAGAYAQGHSFSYTVSEALAEAYANGSAFAQTNYAGCCGSSCCQFLSSPGFSSCCAVATAVVNASAFETRINVSKQAIEVVSTISILTSSALSLKESDIVTVVGMSATSASYLLQCCCCTLPSPTVIDPKCGSGSYTEPCCVQVAHVLALASASAKASATAFAGAYTG